MFIFGWNLKGNLRCYNDYLEICNDIVEQKRVGCFLSKQNIILFKFLNFGTLFQTHTWQVLAWIFC